MLDGGVGVNFHLHPVPSVLGQEKSVAVGFALVDFEETHLVGPDTLEVS